MKRALEPDRPSTRTLVLAVRAADGSTTEWTARQARKKLPDGNRILTVILEPDDVKGVAFLIWEQKDAPDEQWLYLPAVRRPHRSGCGRTAPGRAARQRTLPLSQPLRNRDWSGWACTISR